MLSLAVHAHAQHYRFARVESVAGLDTSANYVIASSFSAPRFLLSNEEAGGGSKLAAKITMFPFIGTFLCATACMRFRQCRAGSIYQKRSRAQIYQWVQNLCYGTFRTTAGL